MNPMQGGSDKNGKEGKKPVLAGHCRYLAVTSPEVLVLVTSVPGAERTVVYSAQGSTTGVKHSKQNCNQSREVQKEVHKRSGSVTRLAGNKGTC